MLEEMMLLMAAAVVVRKRTRKRRQPRRFWVNPIYQNRRAQGDYHNLYKEIRSAKDEQLFFKYTRMSFANFDHLLRLLKPHLVKRSIRTPLNAEERLLITLRYLATGSSMQTLAFSFRCGKTTVWRVITETLTVIWNVLQPIVLKEPSTEEWLRISREFWDLWQFPLCLGSIDGKHVATICPKKSGSEYFNYKGFFSIVLMAICDANYIFTLVDIGQYGSASDSGIFSNCEMGQSIINGTMNFPRFGTLPFTTEEDETTFSPFTFIADEAFPLKQNIMRPYPGKISKTRSLTVRESVFNYRLSRARRVIENTFGILMARWRIFQGPIVGDADLALKVTQACVCLHNYIMKNKEKQSVPYLDTQLLDVEYQNGTVVKGQWREKENGGLLPISRVGSNNSKRGVMRQRSNLANYFVSRKGRVLWQYKHALKGVKNVASILKAQKIAVPLGMTE